MAEMMRKMGIHSHIDEVYSLCLGPTDLSPYEMVAAFNTFPSKGVYITPMYVTRIEDKDGNVLTEFHQYKREAIGERTAYLMVNLMSGVINHGTGYLFAALTASPVRLRVKPAPPTTTLMAGS